MTSPRPFTILTVCTGNICRSPLAEQLLTARLADSVTPFVVMSAGTMAQSGQAMDATAAEMSRAYGGTPADHEATYLTEMLVESADLVLTAGRDHRAAAVRLSPRASRRTFTLTQFAHLVEGADPGELAAAEDPTQIVRLIASLRGMVAPFEHADDEDVVDPYRRGQAVHERAAADIDRAVTTIVSALRAGESSRADA
ncbi:low molecular weight phosphatase family protein [Frigoribacterium sp. 2-23]|uniref:arsenate reductase/protein-tyrosine-phosphatase family protein n=1 Tax=Frigoribacterium sp. 2-23 TaxID=3415006 RepID=UPI003C6FAAC1